VRQRRCPLPSPGGGGSTRAKRAAGWVISMNVHPTRARLTSFASPTLPLQGRVFERVARASCRRHEFHTASLVLAARLASELFAQPRPGEDQGRAERRGPDGPAGLILSRASGGTTILDQSPSGFRSNRKSAISPAFRARCLLGLLHTAPGGRTFQAPPPFHCSGIRAYPPLARPRTPDGRFRGTACVRSAPE